MFNWLSQIHEWNRKTVKTDKTLLVIIYSNIIAGEEFQTIIKLKITLIIRDF